MKSENLDACSDSYRSYDKNIGRMVWKDCTKVLGHKGRHEELPVFD